MTTTTHAQTMITGSARSRGNTLPERLSRQTRTILVCGDAAIIFFVSLLALNGGAGNRVAAAILTAGIICGVFWQCGFYKRSYAVTSRDEAYFACAGIAIAALPIVLILSAIDNMPLFSSALALALSAIGTCALHVRLHLDRRYRFTTYAGLDSISPGAWHDRESAAFRLSKRVFDLTVALIALVVTSPIMLVAAIAIALESGFPVLFYQERVGENGRPFTLFKFRTMRKGSGPQWARPGDDRITRLGAFLRRTSIDELPQLFNVLRGEMSIVGPRPEMLAFAASFAETLPSYPQRHVVPPGITGWAQLYMKRNLQPSDMPTVLPYDLFYVEYSSVLLDFTIVLKTAFEVLFHQAV